MKQDSFAAGISSGQIIRLARREIWAIVTLALIAGGIWGFVAIADLVVDGETEHFDTSIMLALRDTGDASDPLGPDWIMQAARDITALGGFPVLSLMTVCVVAYLLIGARRGAALLVAVSIGGGALLSHFLKLGFDRPRPDLVPHEVMVSTLSFPSGHAMLSAVTYLTLGTLLMRLQPRRREKAFILGVAVLLTMLIGASRVYLGVHWPTDVLAGWCVGAAWALICWLAALWLQRAGRIRPDNPD